MIGSFIDRINARVCYGSGGGGGGGGDGGKSQSVGTNATQSGTTTFFSCVGAVGGAFSSYGAASRGNMPGAYGAALGASAAANLCANGIVAATGGGAPNYSSYNAIGDYTGR